MAIVLSHELGAYWEVLTGEGEGSSSLFSWSISGLFYTISIFPSMQDWFLLSLGSVFLALSLKDWAKFLAIYKYAKLPHREQEQKRDVRFIVHLL